MLHGSTLSRGWSVPPSELRKRIRRVLGPHGRSVKFGARCKVRRPRVNERGAEKAVAAG